MRLHFGYAKVRYRGLSKNGGHAADRASARFLESAHRRPLRHGVKRGTIAPGFRPNGGKRVGSRRIRSFPVVSEPNGSTFQRENGFPIAKRVSNALRRPEPGLDQTFLRSLEPLSTTCDGRAPDVPSGRSSGRPSRSKSRTGWARRTAGRPARLHARRALTPFTRVAETINKLALSSPIAGRAYSSYARVSGLGIAPRIGRHAARSGKRSVTCEPVLSTQQPIKCVHTCETAIQTPRWRLHADARWPYGVGP